MSRRSRSHNRYSSPYGREKSRNIPSPLPYLLVALLAGVGLAYFHFFVFKSLTGSITNAYTGAAMPGVPVRLYSGASEVLTATVSPSLSVTATTGPTGAFIFQKLPAKPVLAVNMEGYASQRVDAEGKQSVDIKLVPNILSGTVSGDDGKPVEGATIWGGGVITHTAEDGTYELKDLPSDRKLVVKAPGYLSTSVQFGQVVTQDVELKPVFPRAIYLSADSIASPGKLSTLLDLVDRTELNAVVIDVKADNSGTVLYDSKLPIVKQFGASDPIISNLDAFLRRLQERDVYIIARLAVFWDQAATSAKPEWALKSKAAPGQPWLDAYGRRWANPHNPQVWEYNLDIAKEVATRGVNEVQFDIAYFPSNGALVDIDYGPDGAGKIRVDAIAGFLDAAQKELTPLGTYVSVDALGLTPFVQDDMGVGQQFDELLARADYVSPFVYPSDFADQFLDYEKPAEHPADVVAQSLMQAVRRAGGAPKIRPWLQDFSREVEYDAIKVRAEIDSAEQNGASGWMLWNFGNVYTEGALKAP
ncbi:MAG TPA: putative glycoside hydrolase [Chloroflexia bacterium]|nr:putative glycoside hydrolase [Chloroflexia bacterium]